jgi:hypothetical protein
VAAPRSVWNPDPYQSQLRATPHPGTLPDEIASGGDGCAGAGRPGHDAGRRGRAWAERTISWRVWERMLENEFIDRGIALAAKAFVSFSRRSLW